MPTTVVTPSKLPVTTTPLAIAVDESNVAGRPVPIASPIRGAAEQDSDFQTESRIDGTNEVSEPVGILIELENLSVSMPAGWLVFAAGRDRAQVLSDADPELAIKAGTDAIMSAFEELASEAQVTAIDGGDGAISILLFPLDEPMDPQEVLNAQSIEAADSYTVVVARNEPSLSTMYWFLRETEAVLLNIGDSVDTAMHEAVVDSFTWRPGP